MLLSDSDYRNLIDSARSAGRLLHVDCHGREIVISKFAHGEVLFASDDIVRVLHWLAQRKRGPHGE